MSADRAALIAFCEQEAEHCERPLNFLWSTAQLPERAAKFRQIVAALAAPPAPLPDVELVAAAVHEAWMQQKRAKGIASAPSQQTGEEQMRPYAELSEGVQEYDRATVRAVYAAIAAARPGVAVAPQEPTHGAD